MKSIEILTNRLANLRDSYNHYTMVDKDKTKAFWIKNDIEETEILLNEFNELKRLKDIKEELGCPLEVIIKALKDGFKAFDYYDNYVYSHAGGNLSYCDKKGFYFDWKTAPDSSKKVYLKDYQKTWWLKGEKYNE